MTFANPHFLALAAAAVLAVIALAWADARRRRRAVERFASPELASGLTRALSGARRRLKIALLALGAGALLVALARPQWGFRWEETERRGTDILFAIDTSKSMLAEDLRPSRLARAKIAVEELVDQFDGDRAGLVAFAGEAFLAAPMTLDREAFQRTLDELDPSIIPRGGTDVSAAIREAAAAFDETDHEKILVVLSDGESLEGDALTTAEQAGRDGIRIFTVGVGTGEGGPVPVPDGRGGTTLQRDPTTGELVRSRLDEDALAAIAEATGGAYATLGADGHGLVQLWRDHLSSLPAHVVATRRHRVFHERFQWPLAIGLAALLLEPWIGERRRRRRGAQVAAAAAVGMLALAAPLGASADGGVDAERARVELERAARGEQRAAVEAFNEGARAYAAGSFDEAVEAFDRAIARGEVEVQQSAYYDRGNARYRTGEATLETDREATKRAWRDAIASYEAALALRAADEDARLNLELVRRRLAALEQSEAPSEQSPADGQEGSSGSEQSSHGGGEQGGEQQRGGQQHGGQQHGGQQHGGQQHGSEQQGSEQQGGLQQQGAGEQQGRGQQSGGDQRGTGQQQAGEQQGSGQQQGSSEPQASNQPSSAGHDGEDRAARSGDPSDKRSGSEASAHERPQDGQEAETDAREREADAANGTAVATDGEAGDRETDDGSRAGEASDGSNGARLSEDDAIQLLRALRTRERRLPWSARSDETAAADRGPTRDW